MRKRVDALAEQLLETLEQQGYRSTSPRRAVAQVIANQDKHFTAEDLREQLPSLGWKTAIFTTSSATGDTTITCSAWSAGRLKTWWAAISKSYYNRPQPATGSN